MDKVVNSMVSYLDKDETRSYVECCKIKLGIQILLHNILMVGSILAISFFLQMYYEAIVLFLAYGALKVTAGGVHFKSSFMCLISTFTFIVSGVILSRMLKFSTLSVLVFYILCQIIIYIVGPQETENNPISKIQSAKMKKQAIGIVAIFIFITLVMCVYIKKIPYLLLIATLFETCTLIPGYIRKKVVKN